MRAQRWSLASQHGMYRLVLVMAPHHRPVQQPKAFVAIEQADRDRPTIFLEIQIGICTHESPHQPRREAHEQDPLRPAARGWAVNTRVSPLAHM
jgi:hypothetical protein